MSSSSNTIRRPMEMEGSSPPDDDDDDNEEQDVPQQPPQPASSPSLSFSAFLIHYVNGNGYQTNHHYYNNNNNNIHPRWNHPPQQHSSSQHADRNSTVTIPMIRRSPSNTVILRRSRNTMHSSKSNRIVGVALIVVVSIIMTVLESSYLQQLSLFVVTTKNPNSRKSTRNHQNHHQRPPSQSPTLRSTPSPTTRVPATLTPIGSSASPTMATNTTSSQTTKDAISYAPWLHYQSKIPLPTTNAMMIGNGTQFAEQWCSLRNHQEWYPTKEESLWQHRAPYFLIPGASNSGVTLLSTLLLQQFSTFKSTTPTKSATSNRSISQSSNTIIVPTRTQELQFFYDHAFRPFRQTKRSPSATTNATKTNDYSIETIQVDAARQRMYALDYKVSQIKQQQQQQSSFNITTSTNHDNDTTPSINPRSISFDATSGYLYTSTILPHRILCVIPWVKIVIVLRNPLDRILEHYATAVHRRHLHHLSLLEWLQQDLSLLHDTGVLPSTTSTTTNDDNNNNTTSIIFKSILPNITTTSYTSSNATTNQNEDTTTNTTKPFRIPLWRTEEDYLDFVTHHKDQEDIGWYQYQQRTTTISTASSPTMEEGPVGRSLYVIQLRQWFQALRAAGKNPQTEVLVVFYENLFEPLSAPTKTTTAPTHNDTTATMKKYRVHRPEYHKILQFLNISDDTQQEQAELITTLRQIHAPTAHHHANNRNHLDPIVSLPNNVRQLLEEFFVPYNNQLIRLLQQYYG